jgi:hypothetical protein
VVVEDCAVVALGGFVQVDGVVLDGSGKLRAAIERVGAFATLLFGYLSFVTRGLPR